MDYSYPLLCASERRPNDVALVGRDGSVTFAELERRISAVAGGLVELGMARRAVGLLMTNRPEVVEVQMALARAECVAVPVNPRLSPSEIQYIARDCNLAAVFVTSLDFAAVAAELSPEVQVVHAFRGGSVPGLSLTALRRSGRSVTSHVENELDDAPATITYTSGTTGRAKGVVRSHRANTWNMVNSALGSPRSPEDVELFNLPAFGIGFLHFLMPALLGNATVILDEAFQPERVWGLIEREGVTRTFLAPTMIASMLEVKDNERFDASTLSTIYTAYAFPARLRERAFERFGEKFAYMYGLTEAQLTCGSADEFVAEPNNVGRTMGVSRIAIFDGERQRLSAGELGEIAFSGPSIMTGYHGLPEATAETVSGEWVMTGDLGRLSAEGELHYEGRLKEIIKTGGFSVDPTEVENILLETADLDEAAVVGTPDDFWGEAVVAFVIARSASIEIDELVRHCRDRVAGFKVPKATFLLDELPKNATGKIDRGQLRRIAASMYKPRH